MLTTESDGLSSAEVDASTAASSEQSASYAQASKLGEGADSQAAAPLHTPTSQRLPSTPAAMGGTTPAEKSASPAPASSAAQLSAPPSRHQAPSTPAQSSWFTTHNAQTSSQAIPTAQHALPHPLPPTAQIRGTPPSPLIRAVRANASAGTVQPLGLANALTAPRVHPTSRLPAAPTGSERTSSGLLTQPGLKGSWAGPGTGSPAAYMDLMLPCIINSAESKLCPKCQLLSTTDF